MHNKSAYNVEHICGNDKRYPASLLECLGTQAPESLEALGNVDLLKRPLLAFFCSIKCPGNPILRVYDYAREMRNAGIAVIGGFHSPMERECRDLLLRGKQPVIICPAQRLSARVPNIYKPPLSEGRLLLLSPFGARTKRASLESASRRNEFVAALAERVFVAYAAPGSRTESFCRKLAEKNKPILTPDSAENCNLTTMGAKPIIPGFFAKPIP